MAPSSSGQISVRIIDNGTRAIMETISRAPGTTLGDLFETRYPDSQREAYSMLVTQGDNSQPVGGELHGAQWVWNASYVLQNDDKVVISPAKFKAAA